MTNQTAPQYGRAERILAYMIAAVIGVSILSFVAVIVATFAGVRDFDGSIWPVVFFLPLVGLPIGFLMIVALMIMTAVKRRRAAGTAGR